MSLETVLIQIDSFGPEERLVVAKRALQRLDGVEKVALLRDALVNATALDAAAVETPGDGDADKEAAVQAVLDSRTQALRRLAALPPMTDEAYAAYEEAIALQSQVDWEAWE